MESAENILLTTKLLEIILHVLNHGLSIVLVLYHRVKLYLVLDAHQGFCEGNALARRRVQKSPCGNWSNDAPDCFHLLSTPLHLLVIWLVESSDGMIWRHHRPEVVEFVDPAIMSEDGQHMLHRMIKYTEIDFKMIIGYDNNHRRNAFLVPEDTF